MSNKCQRTPTSTQSLCITDLPDGILDGISSYLANPSAVLFAKAITADSQQTQTSEAIISNCNWDTLDFSDVEKSLAAKLSDDNIDKILRSIDAVNNLKILKLAGCVNITGSGLNVLRLSVAIQQIDLSLVGKHEAPLIEPEPLLSESVVIPILNHVIISRGWASSLKQLEFPKKWKWNQSTQFTQFLERYNNYLTHQSYRCSTCERICVEVGDNDNEWVCNEEGDEFYGTQEYTCSQCLKHFCIHEECVDENGICSNWCKKCEKEYCKSCVAMTECVECNEDFCNKCEEMQACGGEDSCGKVLCEECYKNLTCSYCRKTRCSTCVYCILPCKSRDCPNTICRDCEMDIEIHSNGLCREHNPFLLSLHNLIT